MVGDNLAAARAAFGFGDATLAVLARNSFDACFAPRKTSAAGTPRSAPG